MTLLKLLEMASYLVTIVGFPIAILALWHENRKERENEEHEIDQRDEEMYVQLSKQYAEFLELLLQYPHFDLLNREYRERSLTPEQKQQKIVLFEILIALFERAYILLYETNMSHASSRRWQSWADYIQWWCQRGDFRKHLEIMLEGEDPDFAQYLRKVIKEGVNHGF